MMRDFINADHPRPAFVADPVATSQFFPASDLDGKSVPDRHWLVHGLIPSGTVTLLTGDGGTGKSLLALQLAVSVASGGAWLGHAVAGGHVVVISAEDDKDELHRRLVSICRSTDQSLADLDNLSVRSMAGEDALLATQSRDGRLCQTPLFEQLDEYLSVANPTLLVLDTLADLFPGNENDRAQARQFVGILRGLAIRHECAVLLLAHPSLTGINSGTGTSGSTGWSNSVRSRLYLERVLDAGHETSPDARVLTNKKSNYGRTGGEIALTWKAGAFVADTPEGGLDRVAAQAKAERIFLELLDKMTSQERFVSTSRSSTYAPAVFAKHPDAQGIDKNAFHAAMERLLNKGKIRLGEHGRGASIRKHIERGNADV